MNSVTESPTISYQQSGYAGDYADQPARSGGKYVIVDTTVLNDSSASIDLTCSFPIQESLTTVDRRQYDTIDSEYKIEGNPECNDNLQPGFDAAMKYVYEIPVAAEPLAFGFAEVESNYDNPTYVALTG